MTKQSIDQLDPLVSEPLDHNFPDAAQALASELEAELEGNTLARQFVTFHLLNEVFAVNMAQVREIIRVPEVTRVPLAPPALEGVANLRGQVMPYVDLSPFVGEKARSRPPGREDRAVIVERGELRFATTGRRIDTVEADPSGFVAVREGALHPALEAEAQTEHGTFLVIHLDRLEASMGQSMKMAEAQEADKACPKEPTANTNLIK